MILSIAKTLTYLLELHLMRLYAIIRRLPVDPLPRYTREEWTRAKLVIGTLWKDWRRVVRENRGAFGRLRPWRHLRRYVSIVGDLKAYLLRKRAEAAEDLAHVTFPAGTPEYYRKNYHYQTDGYFSAASALRYDHQIELLFLGMGHIVRKTGFELAKPYLPAGAEVLEFGAGTGTSGDQFKRIFPDARLTLLDGSAPYLEYAELAYPGRFEGFRAEFIETIEDVERWDGIMCCFTMHEIPQRHWDEVCRRVWRALRPGGIFIIVDSQQNADHPGNQFALDQFQKDFFEPYYPEFRAHPLAPQLERSGFEALGERPVMFSKAWVTRKAPRR